MTTMKARASSGYDVQAIEEKWRAYWRAHDTYRTAGPGDPDFDASRPKFFVLDMFPYPSGKGLHVGHPLGYIATDIVARFKKMSGFNVLHPMGFDAFGLPAEQYALEHNVHPRITTENNIKTMKRQLEQLSLGYDWQRSFATTDPGYYRWTQWIFLQLFASWFDPRIRAARPVTELEAALSAGELLVVGEGSDLSVAPAADAGADARPWADLDSEARRAVLDGQRLAYIAKVPVNWCPGLGTVLANEEVTAEGRSERGDFPVFRRPLEQWMLRITAYADRLIDDLEDVDWPEAVRQMQRNWIGRSHGARVVFELAKAASSGAEGGGWAEFEAIEVFTTRPDTLFGATYMVLSPEHELVDVVTSPDRKADVIAYREAAARKTDIDRQADQKEKSGVFTGGFAINPVNGERVPIWIADYVLMGYGTGAIMAVPAHDTRDFDFAHAFDLPMRAVVTPDEAWLRAQAAAGERPVDAEGDLAAILADYQAHVADWPEAFAGVGESIQSAGPDVSIDGLPTPEAKAKITAWLDAQGLGRGEVQYKLRDWLFSRQRYWGEPFPILHGPDGEIRPVAEDDLPVELPPMEDFQPERSDDPDAPPRPPLGRAPLAWREIEIDGVTYKRELNTMPNWAGSCWYYLRYLSPDDEERMVGSAAEGYWMGGQGVDLYVGGVEHAVLHLLYARFWHKVLFDLGHVSTPEPFGKLFNQGYIQAYAFRDARGIYVPAEEVEERDGGFFYQGEPVAREYGKMGKSLKNMVTPDDVISRHGCDTLRLYEMYMGPLDKSKPWNTDDIVGIRRFLNRVWRNYVAQDAPDAHGTQHPERSRVVESPAGDDLRRQLHVTIAKVSQDMESMSFNTAIAALIELNNTLVKSETLPREVAEPFAKMLAPMAPHLAEELWQRLGHDGSITSAAWPTYDPALLVVEEVELALQVNGKVRGRLMVPAAATSEEIEALALADDGVRRSIEGKQIRKVIVVPGRLINIVAS
jgi:leucyl-tRNA synthetase